MPKAPPTSGATTRICSSSRPIISAIFRRARCGAWLVVHRVRVSRSSRHSATMQRGSMGEGARRGCSTSTCTVENAASKAASQSFERQFLAIKAVSTPSLSSSSRSAKISSAASVAAAWVSAMTAAMGWPIAVTLLCARIEVGGMRISSMRGFTGSEPRPATSAPLMTATTPGKLRASSRSSELISACARGLRRKAR